MKMEELKVGQIRKTNRENIQESYVKIVGLYMSDSIFCVFSEYLEGPWHTAPYLTEEYNGIVGAPFSIGGFYGTELVTQDNKVEVSDKNRLSMVIFD